MDFMRNIFPSLGAEQGGPEAERRQQRPVRKHAIDVDAAPQEKRPWGVRRINHRLEEDNQIQLAGCLNLPTTGKLRELLGQEKRGAR